MPAGYTKPDDLPGVIAVFPLDGALLLPHAGLPLNVFEPRYLNMVDDAMAGDRIIGIIQTRPGGDPERPSLAAVGCAGRITSFSETSDGRYLITLTGVCRFRLGEELPTRAPYRQVKADFSAYAQDLTGSDDIALFDRQRFTAALKTYLHRRGLDVEWPLVEDAPPQALVTSLAMALPFDGPEKQALLEASEPSDRAEALLALLEIDTAAGDDDTPAALH